MSHCSFPPLYYSYIFYTFFFFFFFFNDTATTEIYTLSLHDALPIWRRPPRSSARSGRGRARRRCSASRGDTTAGRTRSEEHTSELQSPCNLVCRLLLEKKNKTPLPPGHPRSRGPPWSPETDAHTTPD